jgi:tetratricopeptide (TPR) repeat protein
VAGQEVAAVPDAERTAITRFVDELRRLRRQAGEPSLNRVVALAAGMSHPLARSTISDKLNARSLPEWEFVASYVTACAVHAQRSGIPLPAEAVDLKRWAALHLRMLRTVDSAHANGRLAASVRAELERRADGEVMVPRQLPPAPRHFLGRAVQLAALDRLAAGVDPPPQAVICAIGGTAGIGKTTLAVHWAHSVADRFPDGQLYANLRGFGPESPVPASDVVQGFLEAFGVPPEEIPTSQEGQVGLYRSLLAGKRILVLLDNARDAEQIRPLLAGSAGCVIVVTSRNRLSSLVAVEGAHSLSLDLLTRPETRAMLAERIGADRVAAEPEAVDRIAAACAGLPLVTAIVAARVATHPEFPLAELANELSGAGGLDAFASGDQALDVRTVMSWSYRGIDPAAARLFRLLALHPGPDIGAPAAASVAGLPLGETRRLLRGLSEAHLLAEHRPGRFAYHDLLRAYAAELAEEQDSEQDRRAAMHRTLDHYLRTAEPAARLLDPHRPALDAPAAASGMPPEAVADARAAVDWFAAEHRNLLALVRQAEIGFDAHVYRLARTLSTYLYRSGRWHDRVFAESAALAAARRGRDRRGEAHAHRGLARTYLRLDRQEAALAQLRLALAAYDELGDPVGQGHTHLNLAEVLDSQRQFRPALHHARLAHDLYRNADHPAGQAKALNSIGWSLSQLGHHQQAVGYCQKALDIQLKLDDRDGAADTLDSLGYAYHQLRQYEEARSCYEQAVAIYREAANLGDEGLALDSLGDVLQAAGELDAARGAWQRAARLLDQLGEIGKAAEIHAKINELSAGASQRYTVDASPPGGAG